jgi:enoyl-CoA hydratase/carnithine racemase
MSNHSLVETSIADGVLHIALNRPEKKNALTRAMYTAMSDALDAARDDSAQRAVVFSGKGGAFTAGNDLMDFASSGGNVDEVMRFLQVLVTFPKPVLAAVHGAAVGIGTTMLLHCDLAWAGRSARFKTPFVDLGLVPEAASSFLMPRDFGSMRAAQLLLLGDVIDADTAAQWGLINGVLDDAELLGFVLEKARHLATRAPTAMRQSKALLRAASHDIVRDTMLREGAIFRERLTSPEAREAMMAFLQKRAPKFD